MAHRGASRARAEHTADAYTAAIASGADGLECDVRLTRDGHLVCVHDRRVNRTSNGTGVVSEFDLAQLQKLNFSSWREEWPESADDLLSDNPYLEGVSPDRDAAGGVLTLQTLLAMIADAARPLRLLVETKHPTRYGGLVEKELVQTLHRFGYGSAATGRPAHGSVAVMSFAAVALRRVRLLDPSLDTVLLQEWLPPGRRDGRLPAGTTITGVSLASLHRDPGFVSRAHGRGHLVYAYTVDEPDDIDFVLDLGVEAIITNDPKLAQEIKAGRL